MLIPGVRRSADEHGLDIQEMGVAELAERFPALAVDPGTLNYGVAVSGSLA